MTKEQAKEIQLKEKNKVNVITTETSVSRRIKKILEKQGIKNSSESLHERVNAFPEPNRSRLAQCFEERKEGNSFYNAVAIKPFAGKILSLRYAQIYDTIYLIHALFSGIINESDLILDVGTCTGFTPITLSILKMGKWIAIDQSGNCIKYAEEACREQDCTENITFTKTTLDKFVKTTTKQFRLVINSRGPRLSSSDKSYSAISKLITQGGFLIYVEEFIPNQREAQKIYNKSGLSLIYRDIVGGWNQTEEEYGVWSLSVFFKGDLELAPGEYRPEYESLWKTHFKDYCNIEVRDKPELKTLCEMRDFFRKN